jgi:hypothetical protein
MGLGYSLGHDKRPRVEDELAHLGRVDRCETDERPVVAAFALIRGTYLSGSASTSASRHSLGKANRMSASSDENDTYATRPARSLSSPRTIASVVRGSVNANDRTSSTLTTEVEASREIGRNWSAISIRAGRGSVNR